MKNKPNSWYREVQGEKLNQCNIRRYLSIILQFLNDNFINLQWLFLSYFLRLLELESVEYELDDVAIELLVADA